MISAPDVLDPIAEVPGLLDLPESDQQIVDDFERELTVAVTRRLEPASRASVVSLLRYPVPKLTPDESCSIHDELADEPFDLAPYLGLDEPVTGDEPQLERLRRLKGAIDLLACRTDSDWSGIYQLVERGEERFLLKLAYDGGPSRAIFPCTEQFALTSNNATAVLTRRAILVRDVEVHVAEGKPYYECDPDVRSELCLPIIRGGEVAGIIDLESFRPEHFTPLRIALTVKAVEVLGRHRLI